MHPFCYINFGQIPDNEAVYNNFDFDMTSYNIWQLANNNLSIQIMKC